MSTPNWENRTIFHRDNLEVLRGMDTATVDLIATDPPFKKGRDFHATPGSLAAGASFKDRWSWDNDVQQDWVDKISDDWPAIRELVESAEATYGEDMAAFLVWMGIRLLEMERVLKPTGSIYLHCDPTASHYLKMLMDAIFTRRAFRNEIIWRIGWVSGFKTQKRGWIRNHEVLLYYVKSDVAKKRFNKEYLPYPDGYVRRDGKPPTGKGIPLEDTWNCSNGDPLHSIMIMSFSGEKTGYPTQKPLKLYERIIKASSNEGEVVLDPFCGCATTCIAAERLLRKWVGIDIWDEAHQVVLDRLQKEDLSIMGDHGPRLFSAGDVTYTKDAPGRTDGGEIAAPKMKKRRTLYTPSEPLDGYTNAQRKQKLISLHGLTCSGCDRRFDFPDYLQLDHNIPRSEGGSNNLTNRLLLCGPCNRRKSNTLTLTGLRRRNQKEGFMA